MSNIVKLPPTSGGSSSRTYAQRWKARMTLEEAMKGVIRMLAAYSEFSPCNPEYMMTLAETLCQFPMEVATAACSPIHGAPKEHKNFRPNAGQISEWCEREAAWLYRMAEREGLLRADSHKTYTGTSNLFNKIPNPYGTLLHGDTNSVAHNKESVSPQQKYTTEERCAHVERLRAQGLLTFDTGPEAERRKSFFDRLTKPEAEKILADYARAAEPVGAYQPDWHDQAALEQCPVPF
jgi:hypothetical protein